MVSQGDMVMSKVNRAIYIKVQVRKKRLFYPVFYGLKLLSPFLIFFCGIERTFIICDNLLKQVLDIKVIE